MEVVDVIISRRINIPCFQETRYVSENVIVLTEFEYKSMEDCTWSKVRIIIDKTLQDEVVDAKGVGEKIIATYI